MSLPPLSPEQLVKPSHFELRMSLIFATLFVSLGIHLPYFPLWLQAKGFHAEQIAVILAAPMFLRVVTTPMLTAFADRAKDRANVYIALVAASMIISAGYFLPATYAIVLAISLLLTIAWTPHSPMADSLALSGVRRFGSKYTGMRKWGSVSYLCANVVGGFILAQTGAKAVPAILFVALAAALIAGLLAPRMGRPRKASPLSAADLQHSAPSLFNAYFLYFTLGVGIITASHAFLYGFVSIYWKSIGIGDSVVGLLWAWGVVSEVGMFLFFNRIFASVSVTRVMMIAGFGAILRWIAFPMVWPLGLGVAGFFGVQTLHSVSVAMVLIGLQKMIGETVSEERTGAAQGIAYFFNGFFMAAVTLASGPLYERLGVDGFLVMIPIAIAGLALIGLAARSAPQSPVRR
ncbi:MULTISPECIES: MFS transporter [unclassified Mesorhizobium]|uniref:MFS transporter n=1 Tax=unclassified Mesorhizobium TaxID=325217 RepID=UPI000BAFB4CF|nr:MULTISPECIES: MFS transporter [unclassified Mesorhizobium]TGT53391.1 MFS transporter [Mesorhizobium sp. M00.F.Ca.ET.170.01.1.1]AZO12752.1 MFS transporter [Mesorhizobium sp. M3A.F.Ca.ET.080.04.2.1]PBB87117.1 MFS transporter [Mesorhizobium sp. WSM3876]RWB71275.1 MAG: MFS transporter [Mesorhizobium sp.]RWB91259.1 MAG: MFS transporter [Mesorhizobium sp.]